MVLVLGICFCEMYQYKLFSNKIKTFTYMSGSKTGKNSNEGKKKKVKNFRKFVTQKTMGHL